MILTQIKESLIKGKAKDVKEQVNQALSEGNSASSILDSMLEGMSFIGTKFKNNEIFVPEVLVAARALNYGLEIIKPILTETGIEPVGKVVIGTVEGDLHDIGKNLVKMMLVGAGFEVVDLGVNVTAQQFVDGIIKENADIVCLSALLTTTMGNMKSTIEALKAAGIRDKVKVMIGGAPVTAAYAKEIGADLYTSDAASASEEARKLVMLFALLHIMTSPLTL